jgi:hypothetical protein
VKIPSALITRRRIAKPVKASNSPTPGNYINEACH